MAMVRDAIADREEASEWPVDWKTSSSRAPIGLSD
jgi:hypothetical protein